MFVRNSNLYEFNEDEKFLEDLKYYTNFNEACDEFYSKKVNTDIKDIKEIYITGLTFIYVENIADVLKYIFE